MIPSSLRKYLINIDNYTPTKIIFIGIIFMIISWFSETPSVSGIILDDARIIRYFSPTSLIKNPLAIVIEPLDSTTLNISRHINGSLSDIRKQRLYPTKIIPHPENLRIKIEYLLIANNLHQTPLLCDKGIYLADLPYLNASETVSACRKELYGYGTTDWENYDPAREDRVNPLAWLCKPKEIYLNYSTNDYVLITNLLSNQAYSFRYSIEYIEKNDQLRTPLTDDETQHFDNVCLPEGPPNYGPQADTGSYYVHPKLSREEEQKLENNSSLSPEAKNRIPMIKNFSQITLYWQTVPMSLITSGDFFYHISCKKNVPGNNTVIYSANVTYGTGHKPIEIALKNDRSYICDIHAANQFGQSKPSTIVISERKNTHGVNLFELYAVHILGNGYVLRWTDMDQFLSIQESRHLITNSGERSRGIYTYYWCLPVHPDGGCLGIEAFGKTQNSPVSVRPSLVKAMRSYQFGVSYSSYNSNYSTGIVWAPCVADLEMNDSKSVLDPMTITSTPVTNIVYNNHTSIHVIWSPIGCKSIYALITKIEINYCKVDDLNPCSLADPNAKNISEHIVKDFKLESVPQEKCKNITIHVDNIPSNDLVITNLKPSTIYSFRVRHEIFNIPGLDWSEPVLSATLPEPEKLKDCSSQVVSIWLAILIPISIILISIIIYRSTLYYKKIKKRLIETNSEMPQRIEKCMDKGDALSEIGLKFWINRYSTPDHQSSSNCESESSIVDCSGEDTNQATTAQILVSNDQTLNDVDGRPLKQVPVTIRVEEYTDNKLEANAGDKQEESETEHLFGPSMSGYVPRQLLTKTTEQQQSYDDSESISEENYQFHNNNRRDSYDQISITSHSSFLQNILNKPHPETILQENY